jgi:hypothetical protein
VCRFGVGTSRKEFNCLLFNQVNFMTQNALTALIPILPGQLPKLKNFLEGIGEDVENNPCVRFRETPSTHFARWVILNEAQSPRLYFSACYDGTFADYMLELTSKLGTGMEPIWTCCQGYPSHAAAQAKEFTDFLLPHCMPPDIFLISFPGLTARQIIRNIAFREMFDDCLDTARPGPWKKVTLSAPMVRTPSALGKCLGNLTGRITDWLVGVNRDAPARQTLPTTQTHLAAAEDKVVQNQMTILSPVKKGFWPRTLLRFFLFIGRFNKPSPEGQFSGLSTIHFARWVLIDGGDNLLFESNYDGSWENYIDDFGDHAASGMNAVWANCVDFPRKGCLDIEAFKEGIRKYQHPAQFFYSAYPRQTVRNIATDLRLRTQLAAAAPFMSGTLD